MRSETDKAEIEVSIFKRFSVAAELEVIDIEKRLPPEPDLLCTIKNGERIAFELVELCDPNLARAFADPCAPENAYIRTSDPSLAILLRKLKKKYDTEYPVDLLCYTNGRIITPPDVIVPTIKPYFGCFDHSFRRAWLLCENKAHEI